MTTPSLTSTETVSAVLSRHQAAAVLGVHVNSIDRRVADGSLPAVKLGARTLIPRAAVEALLAGTPA
jgi:excisionase family DNA binding protein